MSTWWFSHAFTGKKSALIQPKKGFGKAKKALEGIQLPIAGFRGSGYLGHPQDAYKPKGPFNPCPFVEPRFRRGYKGSMGGGVEPIRESVATPGYDSKTHASPCLGSPSAHVASTNVACMESMERSSSRGEGVSVYCRMRVSAIIFTNHF